jgi:hypothetical protein
MKYNTKYKTKPFKDSLFTSLSLSLAMCFMLFIYAPVEIYFNNKTDIWYDIQGLFPICLLVFAVMYLLSSAAFLISALISSKLHTVFIVLYCVSFIAFYIQGNFMTEYLPSFNGADFDWDSCIVQRWYSLALWIIVFAVVAGLLAVLKKERFYKVIKYMGIFFSLMLSLSLVILCITTKGYEKKWNSVVSDNYEFEMSTTQNFCILMLDAVDGDEFTDVLQSNADYVDAFSDFTYFDDVMSAYPYTEMCIPFIFSGVYFENQMSYEDYLLQSFTDSPFFDMLENQNYRMGLYESDAPLNSNKMYRFENIVSNRQLFNSLTGAIKIQLKLAGLKYMPYDLKKHCIIELGDIPRLRKYESGLTGIEFWDSNQVFYADLQSEPITLTDDKCFRFIHIEGAHLPYRYDAEMNVIEDGSATYTDNVEASATIAMTYLQKLKDSGVYDNSVIIIMSDHGYNRNEYDAVDGRQHSILLAKGFNEKHDALQICSAPVSHEDFIDMAARLLNGSDSMHLTDLTSDDVRERRYLLYSDMYHNPITEYIQTGKAGDMNTLIPSGNVYYEK